MEGDREDVWERCLKYLRWKNEEMFGMGHPVRTYAIDVLDSVW